jgi:hypothetical protein
MAVTTVQSKDIRFKISYDDGTTYKKLVCKQAFDIDLSKEVQTEKSDCGEHVSVGNATEATFNFEFILNLTPATGETSAAEVFAAADLGTKVLIKADNADSSPTYYRQAAGYLQNYKESAPLSGLVKGTGTFKVDGSIDITP